MVVCFQPCSRLDYLPPRHLNTNSADHPEKTESKINAHVSRKISTVSTMSNHKSKIPKLVTSKDETFVAYSDVLDGIGCFLGPPYHIQVDPSDSTKQTPCQPVPVHLKESFKQAIDKILQVGVLKPVNKATPQINSVALVRVEISLEISSWESVWILPIWTKWLCVNYTISRPLKILHIILQRLV